MTLYDLIADLRREHPNEAAARTLDMVMVELGRSRDNLRIAAGALEGQTFPPGGREVLAELETRARAARLDNLDYGPPVKLPGFQPPLEPQEPGATGIGLLLGLSAIFFLAASAAAVVAGLNTIHHWF